MKNNSIYLILLALITCSSCSPISKKFVGEYEVVSVQFSIPETVPDSTKEIQWEQKNDETIKLDFEKDGITEFMSSKIIIDKDGSCRVVNTVKDGLYVRIDRFWNFSDPQTRGKKKVKNIIPEITYVPTETRSTVAVQIDNGIYQVVDILPDKDIYYCEEDYSGLSFYQTKAMKEYDVKYAKYDNIEHTIKFLRGGKSNNVYWLKKVK